MSELSTQPMRIPLGKTAKGELVFISREWFTLIAVQLVERAGGASGVSTTELFGSSFDDAGIPEMQALMFANEQGQNQRPPQDYYIPLDVADNNAELRARVDAMETEIQALRQGFQL